MCPCPTLATHELQLARPSMGFARASILEWVAIPSRVFLGIDMIEMFVNDRYRWSKRDREVDIDDE